MEKTQRIVILAAGDFPTHPIPVRVLHEADMVVCCDSAYETIKNEEIRIENYVVIGDGDSLTAEDKAALGDRWIQVDEQDYNDLHKAMQWATSKYSILNSQFSILGATGKREDHTLGNISYLATFVEEYPEADIEMITDYGRLSAFKGRRTFASFPRQQVSLFSMTPHIPVTATDLQWPLKQRCLPTWWEGTLNSALSDSFSVEGGTIIVFQTFEPKEA